MMDIALPYVDGLVSCSFRQQADIDFRNATCATYSLLDKSGDVIDVIAFQVNGNSANAHDCYDRFWTGTREGARIMASGLLKTGYVLRKDSVRNPRNDFPEHILD